MSQINPEFKDLQNPEVLVNHIEELKKSFKSDFPYHVFPVAIQQIVEETHRCLKFPVDYISAAILYACSVSIGITHKVQIMNGWQESAVVYLAIVGYSGINKSSPLHFAVRPLIERDKQSYNNYVEEKKEYDRVNSLSKKDRLSEDEPNKPCWKRLIASDVTPEGLASVLNNNRRGIGLYVDELAGWFNNFNRYSKGSEEEVWLTNWSGKPLCIDRKTSDPIFISDPFVSVAGTIQNGILKELATDKRSQNGFIDRILFSMPENLKKECWSEIELDEAIIDNWNQIVNNLLNLECEFDEMNNPKSSILFYEEDAKDLLFKWQKENTNVSNLTSNQSLKGILSKSETYAIRFTLILHLMNYACDGTKGKYINKQTVIGAIELAEYFKRMSCQIVENSNIDEVSKLSLDKQNLFNALPEAFTTAEGLLVANQLDIPERTFKEFLTNKALFTKMKQGRYTKNKFGL